MVPRAQDIVSLDPDAAARRKPGLVASSSTPVSRVCRGGFSTSSASPAPKLFSQSLRGDRPRQDLPTGRQGVGLLDQPAVIDELRSRAWSRCDVISMTGELLDQFPRAPWLLDGLIPIVGSGPAASGHGHATTLSVGDRFLPPARHQGHRHLGAGGWRDRSRQQAASTRCWRPACPSRPTRSGPNRKPERDQEPA